MKNVRGPRDALKSEGSSTKEGQDSVGIERGKKTKKANNRNNQKNLALNSGLLAKLTDIYRDNLIYGK